METRLGSYILQEPLGAGAMGVVYRARHAQTGTAVALKVIAPGFACNALLVARFQREMKIIQKLMHPHIVRCYETGADGDQRFFVMELIEGGSIATLLKRKGKLSWQETIQYALQVCSALEYAHQHGIIHRDLKPVNLLLDADGKVKLVDFGLALDPDATELTAAGRTVGTVNYMSPEQVRGNPPVSPQTDLYALGCVLFEMLAGYPPFDAESPAETLFKQLSSTPPRVSTIALDCPVWLEKLILKLMEKEPLQRPADARVVAHALRQIQERMAAGGGALAHTGSHAISRTLPVRGSKASSDDRDSSRSRTRSSLKQRRIVLVAFGAVLASVLWALGVIITGSGSRAESLWIESLRHSQVVVRVEAARALGEMGREARGAVPALISVLDDTEPEVRLAAVRALERIGSDAAPAIPTLMRLSRSDDSESVRKLALESLGEIRSGNGITRRLVVGISMVALAFLGCAVFFWARRRFGPTAVPLLIDDLGSDRTAVRRRAARVLSLLGPAANQAVPALLQALKDGDEGVRRGADAALGKIGVCNKTTLPDLIAGLRDRDPFVRTRAAVLLGKIGPAAKSAIPTLISILKDPIDLVRVEVVQSLGRIDVEARVTTPHLTEATRDRSYSVRQAATALLRSRQSPRGSRRSEGVKEVE